MFCISYDTWQKICQMYFGLKFKTKTSYLQWFPFSKLSIADQQSLMSKEFYSQHIKTGTFVLFPEAMHRSENYIQKGDGSFRDSSLLSPVLYLVLQAIGKEIADVYSSQRSDNVEVYYAGNYNSLRPQYKQDYDRFFKSINTYISECQFFIKSDISSFFSNINVDLLMNRIEAICNRGKVRFKQAHLSLYKELLLYCGGGRFPLVENSMASSYLATVIYLDEIDRRLCEFIDKHIRVFDDYRIVRYVDDMYILISSSYPETAVHQAYNRIRNEYSSILKEYGLSLNSKKCCFKPAYEINEELKKSLYDENFRGKKHKITKELFSGTLARFLQELSDTMSRDCLDAEGYNDLIEKNFGNEAIEFTATEVYNYFVYEDTQEADSPQVSKRIIELIKQDVSFVSLDPRRLSALILNTRSSSAIKELLNQLFKRNRAGLWNSYDTAIAISYLIQRGFQHKELICVLEKNSPLLFEYYYNFYQKSFLTVFNNVRIEQYSTIIGNDWVTCFLYFMYWVEKSKHNNLFKFAFYKNFFDRFTACIDFFIQKRDGASMKRPNFKGFYKEGDFKEFYNQIDGSEAIIKEAHKLRNQNPISHSSSELIRIDSKSDTLQKIDKSIGDLGMLLSLRTKSL